MTGRIVKISGPTIEARGLPDPGLHTVVRVGREGLLGEIMRIDRDRTTIQVYEDATGLSLDEPVESSGEPLLAELGPGLLGNVFDGLGRPLRELAVATGDFIVRGAAQEGLDRNRRWSFEPAVRSGDRVTGGLVLGIVQETPSVAHKILAPPDASGMIAEVEQGELAVTEPIVVLDDGRTLAMLHRWPVRRRRPYARRLPPETPFLTGQRVLDCFFPVAAGGTAIVPGGFGTGKTVLEQAIAKYGAADVIVYVGCGERGNEMAELVEAFPALVDPRTGAPLADRTVLLVNTSNMPVTAREASIYQGITIAEYFRDMGKQVALMIDSTSRWAEALRELSSRLEEMPAEEGYPTYLASRLGQFYERAGRVALHGGGEGAITIIGAVSPPGGDFSEPVTQASLRVGGALWALDPDLASRRHFPAIDWAHSYTLYSEALDRWFEHAVTKEWLEHRAEAIKILEQERELLELVQLVGLEAVQDRERAVLESARLIREGFLQQDASDEHDAYCPLAKTRVILALVIELARRMTKLVGDGVPLAAVLAAAPLEEVTKLRRVPERDLEAVTATLAARLDAMMSARGAA